MIRIPSLPPPAIGGQSPAGCFDRTASSNRTYHAAFMLVPSTLLRPTRESDLDTSVIWCERYCHYAAYLAGPHAQKAERILYLREI